MSKFVSIKHIPSASDRLYVSIKHIPDELVYYIYKYVNPMTTMHSVTVDVRFNKLLLDDKYLPRQYQVIKFFEQHIGKIDWHELMINNIISDDFYEQHIDKCRWTHLSFNDDLSDEFCQKYIDKLDFRVLCIHKTKEFIMYNVMNNNKNLDYDKLSYNDNFDELFHVNNFANINWINILQNNSISEKFYTKHIDKINWDALFSSKNFSEEFLLKHISKLNIEKLVYNKNLSEYFFINILETHNFTEREYNSFFRFICEYVKFTDTNKFYDKYRDKINLTLLCNNPSTSEKFVEDNYNKITDKIGLNNGLSVNFYRKHINDISWFYISRNNFENWISQ
jgi:hypothetical protein